MTVNPVVAGRDSMIDRGNSSLPRSYRKLLRQLFAENRSCQKYWSSSTRPSQRRIVRPSFVRRPPRNRFNRVFLAAASDTALANLRSMAGIASVLTGAEPAQSLPQLDDAESLFVQAWLSSRRQGKQRRGEGLDWDTPPMLPPDPTR